MDESRRREHINIDRPLLRAREAAKLMRMPIRQVYELLKDQELIAVRFGRLWRIFPDDLDWYMDKHEMKRKSKKGTTKYTNESTKKGKTGGVGSAV